MKYTITVYETTEKKLPFIKWLNNISDIKTRVAIELRIGRIEFGNFCNCKPLCKGLYELKIDIGPGYRIYYSKSGYKIILLLFAGKKKTQQKDIDKAREYLKDYKTRG